VSATLRHDINLDGEDGDEGEGAGGDDDGDEDNGPNSEKIDMPNSDDEEGEKGEGEGDDKDDEGGAVHVESTRPVAFKTAWFQPFSLTIENPVSSLLLSNGSVYRYTTGWTKRATGVSSRTS
jgi:hypothetical protein